MLLLTHQAFQYKHWILQIIINFIALPMVAFAQRLPAQQSYDSFFKANQHQFFLLYENLEKMCKLKYRFYDLYPIFNEKFSLDNQDKILYYKSFHLLNASKKNEGNFCIQLKQELIQLFEEALTFDNKARGNQSSQPKESIKYSQMDLKICVNHQGKLERKLRLCTNTAPKAQDQSLLSEKHLNQSPPNALQTAQQPVNQSIQRHPSIWLETEGLDQFRVYQSDHPQQDCRDMSLSDEFLGFFIPLDAQIEHECQKSDQKIDIFYRANHLQKASQLLLAPLDQSANQEDYPRYPLRYQSKSKLDHFDGKLAIKRELLSFRIESQQSIDHQNQVLLFHTSSLFEKREFPKQQGWKHHWPTLFASIASLEGHSLAYHKCGGTQACQALKQALIDQIEQFPKLGHDFLDTLSFEQQALTPAPQLFDIQVLLKK